MAGTASERSSRRTFLVGSGALVGTAFAASGCTADAGAETVDDQPGVAARNKELVRSAFELQVGGPDTFYSILAEDVQWTIASVEPSTYTSREQFFTEGSAPILDRLTGPIQATVRNLYADGDTVVAWWDGTATARDGVPYVNSYCWIMQIRDEQVTDVVAFLDLVAIADLVDRVDAG